MLIGELKVELNWELIGSTRSPTFGSLRSWELKRTIQRSIVQHEVLYSLFNFIFTSIFTP